MYRPSIRFLSVFPLWDYILFTEISFELYFQIYEPICYVMKFVSEEGFHTFYTVKEYGI